MVILIRIYTCYTVTKKKFILMIAEPAAGYTGSIGKVGAYQLAGSQSTACAGAGFKF